MACLAGGLGSIVAIGVLSRVGVDFTLTIAGNAFDFADSQYIVIPGVIFSIGLLIIVSLLTQPSPSEKWKPFFAPADEAAL